MEVRICLSNVPVPSGRRLMSCGVSMGHCLLSSFSYTVLKLSLDGSCIAFDAKSNRYCQMMACWVIEDVANEVVHWVVYSCCARVYPLLGVVFVKEMSGGWSD
eukprot:6839192-Ditylum_brightwellii.AAC.1